uniref:Uncharacterized protein n=1 Tax=Cacopsylla melanoneura TaxID=428564 RepID=A0A8D9B4W1_9HEMI
MEYGGHLRSPCLTQWAKLNSCLPYRYHVIHVKSEPLVSLNGLMQVLSEVITPHPSSPLSYPLLSIITITSIIALTWFINITFWGDSNPEPSCHTLALWSIYDNVIDLLKCEGFEEETHYIETSNENRQFS